MVEGKRIVVAGFAVTGQAVVEFLSKRNCEIIVSEKKSASTFGDLPSRYPGVRFEFEEHKEETFLNADLIILSPGIPVTLPPIQKAKEKGIPVRSEIELAYRYLRGTIIGITGTNGKSTTTELTGAMLRAGNKKVNVCGNIGTPLIRFCDQSTDQDFHVVEISSFQLETMDQFRPHIAAVINLAEDHLDWYPSVEPYFAAKMRIFENQKRNDFAVLNYDVPYLRERGNRLTSQVFWFSRKEKPPSGLYAQPDGLIKTISGGSVLNFSFGRLQGVHNLENTLCAASIGMLCGVPPKAMQSTIENFQGLPHRMELVGEVNGVRFYDDSKATNVDAVVKSLESFPGNVWLIMGGKDKGCDYRVLHELVHQKVKKLFLIGEGKERIARELGTARDYQYCATLEEAVRCAAHLSEKGDVVLLSPACSSFDMFRDYKHRGEVFAEAVRSLQKTNG